MVHRTADCTSVIPPSSPHHCAPPPVRSRIHIEEDDEYLGHAAVLSPSSRAPARHPSAAFPVPTAGESRRWEQAPCNRGVLLRWCCRIDILQNESFTEVLLVWEIMRA
ncbi:uncharacterized protein [Triticum aestivum]|uniref:uncharacterized protein n=1 Tax=Triticum aestivum TaxID=4565 RepID=UPI001D013AD3|nr:uncharacterized protein LOC123049737 [Triticum aestivum]